MFAGKHSLLESVESTTPSIFLVNYWKTVILFFLAGLFIVSGFAWMVYLGNKIGGDYFASEPLIIDPQAFSIDKERIQADLLLLQAKQVDLLKSKADHPQLIDPSL